MEPFGPAAEDLRHGILCSTVAAPNVKPGSDIRPADFMLSPEVRKDPTEKDTEAGLDALFFGRTQPG